MLGSSGSQAEDASVSILSAVGADEKSARKPEQPGVPTRVLLVGLVVAIGACYFLRTSPEPASATTPEIAQARASSATAVASAPDAAPQTAVIQNTAEAGPAATPRANAVSPAQDLGAALAALAQAPVLVDREPSSGKASKPAAGAARSAVKSPKPSMQTARDKAQESDDRLLSAINRTVDGGKPAAQRDIDLIEALLQHGEPSSAAMKARPKLGAGPGSKISPAGAGIVVADKRGVVERRPGVSTTELIRKCEEFGALEGLLCRIRICENLWGDDAACPAQAAPSGAR